MHSVRLVHKAIIITVRSMFDIRQISFTGRKIIPGLEQKNKICMIPIQYTCMYIIFLDFARRN